MCSGMTCSIRKLMPWLLQLKLAFWWHQFCLKPWCTVSLCALAYSLSIPKVFLFYISFYSVNQNYFIKLDVTVWLNNTIEKWRAQHRNSFPKQWAPSCTLDFPKLQHRRPGISQHIVLNDKEVMCPKRKESNHFSVFWGLQDNEAVIHVFNNKYSS
jgi:hypothetical protein